jgi:hypothetical protein
MTDKKITPVWCIVFVILWSRHATEIAIVMLVVVLMLRGITTNRVYISGIVVAMSFVETLSIRFEKIPLSVDACANIYDVFDILCF